jgi:cytoskeletal protein CcmA (bactofilin family)
MPDPQNQTIIESGTELDGSINSRCPVTVSGKLKGELLAPSLTVTKTGSVQGHVKVERLVSDGEIAGDIDADSVELSGKVSDRTVINARALEVRLDQPAGVRVSFGDCELRVGGKPGAKVQPEKERQKEKDKVVASVARDQPKGAPVL